MTTLMCSTRSHFGVLCSKLLVIFSSLLSTTLSHMPHDSSPPWLCSKADWDCHVNCMTRSSVAFTSLIIVNDHIRLLYVSRRAFTTMLCNIIHVLMTLVIVLYEKICDGLCNIWNRVTSTPNALFIFFLTPSCWLANNFSFPAVSSVMVMNIALDR